MVKGMTRRANENVERVNGGVAEAPDFSTIIAQQLQNLLPAILAQVGNQGNVGIQNGNVVNENVQENVRNVLVNGNRVGCSYKEFLACNPKEYDGKGDEFCPSHEMQKLKIVLWNHVMVGAGHATYTDRFYELARLVPHLVTPESRKIERYMHGLAPQIRGWKCILKCPYIPSTVVIQVVPATENSPAVPEHTTVETILNMSLANKAHFESEKEAIHMILTGIGSLK
ncbi:hypothetical protein Tco_0079202 [Tanacetum coccineum]